MDMSSTRLHPLWYGAVCPHSSGVHRLCLVAGLITMLHRVYRVTSARVRIGAPSSPRFPRELLYTASGYHTYR